MNRPSYQWIKDKITKKIGDLSELSTSAKTSIVDAINELFISVGNGKTAVASAITDKGVPTAADATFAVMANNIAAIPSGGDVPPPEARGKLFDKNIASETTTSAWISMTSPDADVKAHKDDPTLAVSWYALEAPTGAAMIGGLSKAEPMTSDGKYGLYMRTTSAGVGSVASLTVGVRDGSASTGVIHVTDDGAVRIYQNSSYKIPAGDYIIAVSW